MNLSKKQMFLKGFALSIGVCTTAFLLVGVTKHYSLATKKAVENSAPKDGTNEVGVLETSEEAESIVHESDVDMVASKSDEGDTEAEVAGESDEQGVESKTEETSLIASAQASEITSEKDTSSDEDESKSDKEEPETQTGTGVGPIHRGVTATLFWVGEEAGDENGGISNVPSAWDEKWSKSFGGVDDPKKRNGFFPSKFSPKENPFYVALPYNDFDDDGDRRSDAKKLIPWANEKKWESNESMCKNQWVKIMKGNKVAYAQWEDVGPFGEHDAAYVFGTAEPKSKTNKHAGIDLSPAVNDYLDLSDMEKVDWQFVSASQVPDGPWKKKITTSQVSWK